MILLDKKDPLFHQHVSFIQKRPLKVLRSVYSIFQLRSPFSSCAPYSTHFLSLRDCQANPHLTGWAESRPTQRPQSWSEKNAFEFKLGV